jgi:hypothetical protein
MSLLLHELVHVDQYQVKGRAWFACEYGKSIVGRFSSDIPLEWEADDVQDSHHDDLVEAIDKACEATIAKTVHGDPMPSDWFWLVWN